MWRWILLGCGGLIALVVVIVILVAVIAAISGGGDTPNQPSSPSTQPASPKQKGESTVGVDQTATVDDAAWVVTSAQPTTQITDQFGVQPPKQGNFVIVDFNFTNNGNEAKTLSSNTLALYDSSNRKFSPDTDTFGYIPNDKNIFLNQVNPGVTKNGEVIFSVAPGASGFKLELSDTNLFSRAPKAYVDLGF